MNRRKFFSFLPTPLLAPFLSPKEVGGEVHTRENFILFDWTNASWVDLSNVEWTRVFFYNAKTRDDGDDDNE